MTDRPIIFSAPMILALLGGRKTQTRRLASSPLAKCLPGDKLWVRENLTARPMANFLTGEPTNAIVAAYAADDEDVVEAAGFNLAPWWKRGKGLPSIHCPRWASRITLTVTEVRRQRLWEISDLDARAEGTHGYWQLEGYPAFRAIWSDLHGAENWDANPEIVALTFTVERRNIDAKDAA